MAPIELTTALEWQGDIWPVIVTIDFGGRVLAVAAARSEVAPAALLVGGYVASAMLRQGWPLDADLDVVAELPAAAAAMLGAARQVATRHALAADDAMRLAADANRVRGA